MSILLVHSTLLVGLLTAEYLLQCAYFCAVMPTLSKYMLTVSPVLKCSTPVSASEEPHLSLKQHYHWCSSAYVATTRFGTKT
jgi:hypothetical protein